ncbi:MAG: hypothetical protein GY838_03810 [bacterium]|nr:hypothetical protein [bacterium]
MKCLTIRQPWAWAIVYAGKFVENRTWSTWYRGPLLIHAGLNTETFAADREWLHEHAHVGADDGCFAFGAIVGVAQLLDCCRPRYAADAFPGHVDPGKLATYAHGPICWCLDNRRAFATPIPYRGQQGLFDVPEDVVREELGFLR